MTARVRQNPPIAAERVTGEHCPEHGWYAVPPEAIRAHRSAVAPGVDPGRARRLLAESARLRRTCPECGDVCPTMLDWAISVRRRCDARPRFVMPDRATVDPEACEAAA